MVTAVIFVAILGVLLAVLDVEHHRHVCGNPPLGVASGVLAIFAALAAVRSYAEVAAARTRAPPRRGLGTSPGDDAAAPGADDLPLARLMLAGVDLRRARLDRAALRDAILDGARLERAELAGAILIHASLREARLEEATLLGASLQGADLAAARLERADLRYALLAGADLSGADLRGADLSAARLEGADLTGADLRGAVLPDDARAVTLSDATTRWPAA